MRPATVGLASGLCRSVECRVRPRSGGLRRASGAADPPAVPILSSSIVLTRQRAQGQFDYEVLLMRRHAGSSFMPGLFVFPGGSTDESDFSAPWLRLVGEEGKGSGAAGPLAMGEDPKSWEEGHDSLGLRISALRELFEEAGVLARSSGDAFGAESASNSSVAAWRARVHADGAQFEQMAEAGLAPPVERLLPWLCIVTPRAQPKRFRTFFYTLHLGQDGSCGGRARFRSPGAAQPGGAGRTAVVDGDELTDLVWLAPGDALARHGEGELPMAPPQYYLLRRMQQFPTAAGLHAALRELWAGERLFHTFEPAPRREGEGSFTVLLPGDADYGGPTPPRWEVGRGARNRLHGNVPAGGPFREEHGEGATPYAAL